jgi:hypothetical protein
MSGPLLTSLETYQGQGEFKRGLWYPLDSQAPVGRGGWGFGVCISGLRGADDGHQQGICNDYSYAIRIQLSKSTHQKSYI